MGSGVSGPVSLFTDFDISVLIAAQIGDSSKGQTRKTKWLQMVFLHLLIKSSLER